MQEYLKNWNFMRVLRLVLSIFIVVQGVMTKEWLIVGLGGLFALMPLMNIGCCGVSGCRVPVPKNNQKMEDITYEEVINENR